ncbi:MAG TPA: alpha-glucan family phosphorylase [Kofleriaceae bacterium]|nr:alpha-glucan family phosphorylase [Kofleriaceae bacterium]
MSTSASPRVAYFCMEYGLDASFPIYSGGLGILAGDYMKSAGDLCLPVVGIGLLWNQGYTVQTIDARGNPVDAYPLTPREAIEPVAAELEVTIGDRAVPLRAFRVTRFLRSTLYLLEPARQEDRWITARLYGGGDEDRLAQEIVLGVGGVRLLQALGQRPDVYHFNEGHAVFAGLELVSQARARGLALPAAIAEVRPHIVFTTHTPVAAGNEVHPLALMRRMGATLDFSDAELAALGGAPFSMTVAGLRLACRANAVAALHGETARAMWEHVSGGSPIESITNGVHVPTWQDPRIRAAAAPEREPAERREALGRAHEVAKAELLALIAARTGVALSPTALLVGFARRAAPYKRADLIFTEPERLDRWFADNRLQLVFSGKAHPADARGKAMVSALVAATRRWPEHVVFLENYDMVLGAALTRGCDVWLNNPRRPLEASGTSGMKAAMNGVPNVSILDGWWPEGCEHGVTGWQIGDGTEVHVEGGCAESDARDAAALYHVLGDEVLPRFERDRDAWLATMDASIAMAAWRFSSNRMVDDYYRRLYSR